MAMVRVLLVEIMRKHGFNLLTPDEVSELTKKDIQTIYRHIRNGTLAARRIKGSLRIELADAMEYMKGEDP